MKNLVRFVVLFEHLHGGWSDTKNKATEENKSILRLLPENRESGQKAIKQFQSFCGYRA
jgi:hypothetical protein